MRFTHLHLHSHYSLLDGLSKIDEIVSRVKELGMEAVALTDHGNLYGAIEFYQKARKAGIKPILGCELYLAPRSRYSRDPSRDAEHFHLPVLCENETGYRNLLQLVTKSHLEGFYYKPRVDKELLREFNKGLIVLSGCLSGEIPRAILAGNRERARALIAEYIDIFGKKNFYLELQHHPEFPEQKKVNDTLKVFAKEFGLELVVTTDAHYPHQKDKEAHDILLAVQTGAKVDDAERMTMKQANLHIKSLHEIAKDFEDVPEALENTWRVAERCNLEIQLDRVILPEFMLEQGETSIAHLRKLADKKFADFYDIENQEAKARLLYELDIIEKTGFADYFLIVHDFIEFAKSRGIPTNTRGSAAGSLISYILGITTLDPIYYGLYFERFLNPERVAPPDIDLDVADSRRGEIIEYIRAKYGRERVAQIITFGVMKARLAVRDVSRALGLPYALGDQISKLIPFNATIDATLESSKEMRDLRETNPDAKAVLEAARRLEGVVRHASTHAAGIVISKEPLVNYVPLQQASRNSDEIITQYSMYDIEKIGLLKIDVLGLANLTIIKNALRIIKKIHNEEIDLDKVGFEDSKTYELLSAGRTIGVFQLESSGMTRFLKDLKPSSLEDIIAMVSLYRPGPLEAGMIPEYISRKHGRKKIEYLDPRMKPILKETYGIIVYQEQLMKIAQVICGFTMPEADILRKAIGKKIKKLLDEQRDKFVNGAIRHGLAPVKAGQLWEFVEPFARYGFNKCVTGDTKIINAETGELIAVEDLIQDKTRVKKTVTCDLDTLKLKKGKITAVMENGVKPVYRLTTQLGRTIKATSNHPFYTFSGWKPLGELAPGARIAVPRVLPLQGQSVWPDYQVILLGYLLAEGNLCHPYGFYYYTTDDDQLSDYIKNLERFTNTEASVSRHRECYSVYAKRIRREEPSEAVEWAKQLDLYGKNAREKEFPQQIFTLKNRQIGLLISRMWEGDGHINVPGGSLYYATSSEKLARQLQHLLLRFGIISRLRNVLFPYKEGRIGYQVFITGHESMTVFNQHIAAHFISQQRRKSVHSLAEKKPHSGITGTKDIIPLGIKEIVRREKVAREITWPAMRAEADVSQSEFYATSTATKAGFTRPIIAKLAEYFDSDELRSYANSDIYWDRIVAIEYVGEEPTYDLTIDGTHNFVADDFIVHNSHGASYARIAYQTAWLKAHYPSPFMAALLTSDYGNLERIAIEIAEANRMGIKIIAPNVNKSFAEFGVIRESGEIIFSLAAIKGIGAGVAEIIQEERKKGGAFTSLANFVERMPRSLVNRKTLECLIKSGAMDDFGERKQMLEGVDNILRYADYIANVKNSQQPSLFGDPSEGSGLGGSSLGLKLPSIEPASNKERLQWEKELLGLYLSDHPLAEYGALLAKLGTPISKLSELLSGASARDGVRRGAVNSVTIGGVVASAKQITTKTGKPMLFSQVEDADAKVEVVVFPDILARNPKLWQVENLVLVRGRVDNRNGSLKFIVSSAEHLAALGEVNADTKQ